MDRQAFISIALTTDQQIDLLKQRGLHISSTSSAKQCLESVSFHRLGAYCSLYEEDKSKHEFKPNTTFQHVWNLYVFDRELRLLVLDVIERVEIALRTALTNHLSVKHKPWWYLNDEVFKASWSGMTKNRSKSPKEMFLAELNSVCKNQKHNETIKKYYQQYDKPFYPPSWIVLEFLSFGKCTSLFRYLRSHQDKSAISAVFGVHHNIFESALEPLRYTRNLCAHHSRLWDRWFVYKPRNLKEFENIDCKPGTMKEQLALLNLLLKTISPKSSWKDHLYDLFARYEDFVIFESMGFNKCWSDDPFWQE